MVNQVLCSTRRCTRSSDHYWQHLTVNYIAGTHDADKRIRSPSERTEAKSSEEFLSLIISGLLGYCNVVLINYQPNFYFSFCEIALDFFPFTWLDSDGRNERSVGK